MCGYAGSNQAIAVERDSKGKERLGVVLQVWKARKAAVREETTTAERATKAI